MAVLPIAKLGNPVLRKIAARVDPRDIRTKEFQQLIDDMFETMVEEPGIGLAAPQVSQSIQLVIMGCEVDLEDHRNNKSRRVQITVPGQNGGSSKTPRATCLSPMGRALFLKSPGDEVEVEAPSGILKYTVQSITLLYA
jgi:peptide deformylase